MASANPPNWSAFSAAVDAKDALAAWLAFKDILFSDVEKLKVSSEHVNKVLYLLLRFRPFPKVKLMLETLEYAKQLNLPPNIDSQNLLLEAYSRNGDKENAQKVALEFGQLGLVPNLRTYNLFLQLHVKDGNLPACIAFYERMIEEGIEPDVHTFNSLIQGCLKLNKKSDVALYFEEMLNLGINPDQRTVTHMIQYISKCTQPTESTVAKLLNFQQTYIQEHGDVDRDPESAKVEANAAIYTALMKSYGDHDRIDLARTCFDKAKKLPDADAHVYTTMLHILVESAARKPKHHQTNEEGVSSTAAADSLAVLPHEEASINEGVTEEALALFQEMLDIPNMEVDSIAFATLVQMFVQARDLDRAELVVNVGMKTRGIPVTYAVWTSLLEGYIEAGRVADAVRLFEQMKMEGSSPSTHLYNLVLKGLAADFDMELLERHWGRWLWSLEMEEAELARDRERKHNQPASGFKTKHGLRKLARPDAESYTIVVDAYVACQDIDRAMKEVSKMMKGKFVPSARTFVSLIEAHVRRRDYKAAAETMLMMRTAVATGKNGAATLHRVVKANAKQFEALVVGLLETSESLQKANVVEFSEDASPKELAKLADFAENSAELAAEMKAKRVLGVELYKEMISADCAPTEETFACVIRAHGRAKDLVSAIKAWMSFRSLHSTVVPQHSTVNALLLCVKDLGKQASAQAVIDLVKKEELKLDAEGYGYMLYLYARWGWREELISAVVDMVNAGTDVTNQIVSQIEDGLAKHSGVGAAAKQRDVLRFIEENWPEALSFKGEIAPMQE
ncbi:hypothetical protein BDR26DRAFT_867974 [Obelidium mucronatum]|nr:hypothetical protein BDR26DRAFT_867974 [Obelidium mucronatum]